MALVEKRGPMSDVPDSPDAPEPPEAPEAETVRLTVMPSGREVSASRRMTLLNAAFQGGIDLPSSCRNGTCRACLCRLVSGTVHYRVDWPGVTKDEQAEGWILPCIAYPTGDVTIDQPGMRETADIPVRPARSRGF